MLGSYRAGLVAIWQFQGGKEERDELAIRSVPRPGEPRPLAPRPTFVPMLIPTAKLLGVDLVREDWPFTALRVLALLLLTLFPQIVLCLPQTMGYVTR